MYARATLTTKYWYILGLVVLGSAIGTILNSPNNVIGQETCPEETLTGTPLQLWHSYLAGDAPLEVGFYLSEDNYLCHVKRWHWGDKTPDEYGINPAIDHRYQTPCETNSTRHPSICAQWQPTWNFNGSVQEWDSSGTKLEATKNFTVTVNHRDYQIITGFDQRQGVIVPNDTVQFSVATGHSWSGLSYYWNWGDDTSNATLDANPSHKYDVTNDFFCSDSVACSNYTGTVAVSTDSLNPEDPRNHWWENAYPNVFNDVSDVKTFSVLVIDQSESHIKPEIQVSTQNESNYSKTDFVQPTRFLVNEPLYFWVFDPKPNRSFIPMHQAHASGFTATSECPNDPWHFDTGGCGTPYSHGNYNVTRFTYSSPGQYNVTVTALVNNRNMDLKLPVSIIGPSLHPSTQNGSQGQVFTVNGSWFPHDQVIDLYWYGINYGSSLVQVGKDGTFSDPYLVVPPLPVNYTAGDYTLCARSIPHMVDEAEINFTITEKPAVTPFATTMNKITYTTNKCHLQTFSPSIVTDSPLPEIPITHG